MSELFAKLRLGVVFLVFFGLASPIIGPAIAAGAQADQTCEDFDTQAEAQEAMEDDPDLEEELDQDGDGEACNEEGNVTAEDVSLPEDEEETPAADEEETPADDEEDAPSSDADGEEYVSAVQDEVDSLQSDVARFLEVNDLGDEATEDDYADLLTIAEDWAQYDDVASELVAPEGFEDLDASYQDLAEYTVTSGELWVTAEEALIDGDEDLYSDTLDQFNEDGFLPMQEELDTIQGLLDDAGSQPSDDGSSDDGASNDDGSSDDGSSEDGNAYLETVSDEVTGITDSIDEFNGLIDEANDASDAERPDIQDEFNTIAEGWVDYPDAAAEIEAPEGFEDIDEAYQDFAASVGEMGENWQAYWDAEIDSDEEAEAQDAFVSSVEDVQSQAEDLNTLIEDASGNSSDDGAADDGSSDDGNVDDGAADDGSSDDGSEPDGDTEDYLATVQENYDELSESVDRFNELLESAASGDTLSDADAQDLVDILDLWTNAPDVAADLDVPDGMEDIQSLYEEYTGHLADASAAFGDLASSESGSAAAEQAAQDFQDALDGAASTGADLEDALAEAGA